MKSTADVLIVTVTEVESKAVIETFQQTTGQAPKPAPIGDRLYHDPGVVNGPRVLIRSNSLRK